MATITSQSAGDFATGSNWVGGVAPSTGDTAEVGHAMTLSDHFTDDLAATNINSGGSVAISTYDFWAGNLHIFSS